MYHMKYWFEHGGGCLWSANAAANERYGYAVDEQALPIDDALKCQLKRLEQWYHTYLNWEDPAAGCRWTSAEIRNFRDEAVETYHALCAQLGNDYVIENVLALSGV